MANDIEPAVTIGVDDRIEIAGRQTTLRAEYQLGRIALVRGSSNARMSEPPFSFWALVRKDWESVERFRISRTDFKLLSVRPKGGAKSDGSGGPDGDD